MSTVLDVEMSGAAAILWPVEKALLAALVAFAVAAVLTPLAAKVATALGVVDEMKDIGLARSKTPLLGGLAIFAGTLVAGLIFLPDNQRTEGILAGAALITIVGALDDIYDLPPWVKLVGADRGGGRAGHQRRRGGRVHVPVRAPRGARRARRRRADRVRARAADEHRQLLRRRGRSGRGRLRDRRSRVRGHRLRPRARDRRHPGRDHLRRLPGLPDLQLRPGLGLHGRLRLQPARAAAGRGDHRGHAEDERA